MSKWLLREKKRYLVNMNCNNEKAAEIFNGVTAS